MTGEAMVRWVVDQNEGGYDDHPRDRGGPTQCGVTATTIREAFGRDPEPGEIAGLTRDRAIALLTQVYYTTPALETIPDVRLRMTVLDAAILQGPGRAVTWLQRALGIGTVSGRIGPLTRSALATLTSEDAARVRASVLGHRLTAIGEDLAAHPDQVVWIDGWLDRLQRVNRWRPSPEAVGVGVASPRPT